PPAAKPRVGLVLGSGLGVYANYLDGRTSISYRELPGFPSSAVEGHAGNLVYGRGGRAPGGHDGTVEVLALQGRVHYYEGHDLATVVLPVRALVAAGCD